MATTTIDQCTANQLERLTKREKEIVQLLGESMKVREIAERLGISAKTVDTHKTNVMRKLDVHNRVDLFRFALRSGLARP